MTASGDVGPPEADELHVELELEEEADMKRTKRIMCTGAVLVMMIAAAPAVADPPDPAPAKPSATAGDTAVRPEVARVDQWQLLQRNGAQLYEDLCATCHGADGSGAGLAARSLPVYPPPLNRLAKAGVPEEHWTYVILAPCEDAHHWGPHGAGTMPCWQRVFRQALGGTDAGPMLVSAKLRTYLKEIQE